MKKALFLVNTDIRDYGVNGIKSNPDFLNKQQQRDTLSLVFAIRVFENNGYEVFFETASSFIFKDLGQYDFVVANTHRVNRENLNQSIGPKTKKLLNDKTNFIFIHHFFHLFDVETDQELNEILGIKLYRGNRKFYQSGQFNAIINDPANPLTSNVKNLLKSPNFGDDEFTYLKEENLDFNDIITKNKGKNNFVLYGYKEFNNLNRAYIIDIHHIGKNANHRKLFELLLDNSIKAVSNGSASNFL